MVCPSGTILPLAGTAQLLVRGFDAGALFLAGRRRRVWISQPGKQPGPVFGWDGGHRLALDCIAAALAMLSFLAATSLFLQSSLCEISAAPAVRRLVAQDLALDSLLATGVLLSGLYLLAHLSPSTLTLVGAAALVVTHPNLEPTTGYGVSARHISTRAVAIVVLTIAILALLSQTTIRLDTEASKLPTAERQQHKKRLTACLSLLTLLLAATSARPLLSQPQDPLKAVRAAQRESDDWVRLAGVSQSAAEAAAAYRTRYGRHPPPNFDRWVAFALERGSPVIDTFDQIEGDLAPFRGLSPAELRRRTSDVLSARGGLGIGAIRIRGGGGSDGGEKRKGRVELGPGSPPTHFWMLEAWRDMLAPFAADLPDMDLAFNLDDECRVAVPRGDLEGMLNRDDEKKEAVDLRRWFSNAAHPPWDYRAFTKPGSDVPEYFTNKKPRPGMYDELVAPACPPNSAALQYRWTDPTLAMPAARGGIITTTPDLCDRPDLARLSGFLASPGGPGGSGPAITQRLVPIFSQARLAGGGFNDILVPSPWHFADKVVVDEDRDVGWANKSDTVFWRGSSSDGWAEGGRWAGFLRARLVNLAKGLSSPPGLSFFSRGTTRPDAPAVDVSFTGEFTRCSPAACRSMAATFYGNGDNHHPHASSDSGPARTDFQAHWSHRHLIDVDGTGFSGRFLPFLQSRSTPYRATVFRTWMDERIHPWRHFVPLDVSLSGLWEVVWFVSRGVVVRRGRGVDGDGAGWQGQQEEDGEEDEEVPLAREIAMEGHRWAARALRKEDMQVYMFRLLLEWGRMVDDRRDELGYEP